MEAAGSKTNWAKPIASVLLLGLLVGAFAIWLDSDAGKTLRTDPRLFGDNVRTFIDHHPVAAPLAYLGIYVLLSVLAMPIWWILILAGLGFGLLEGILLSLIASTAGAGLTVLISRWIAGDWFHNRVEGHMEKLKALDQTLGHNGLLVVMSIRLAHLLPFGLSNYALGLSRVSYLDVLIGTFLGNIPALSVYVGLGAHYNPLRNWKFDCVVATINIVLLLPLILRYLRPDWFKKIGVE